MYWRCVRASCPSVHTCCSAPHGVHSTAVGTGVEGGATWVAKKRPVRDASGLTQVL